MAIVDKPTDYFNTKLYTGNSTDDTAITGLDFAPSLCWIKNRTDTNSHALFDTVRGATKYIESDTTDAEATGATFLKSFTSDGFVLGTGGRVNNSGNNYASWNWKAGGTASSNTDGSITSSVSSNATSGFSIVSYTGTGSLATVGHGLGVAPAFIIFKDRSTTKNWFIYHQSISPTNGAILNLATNPSADINYFNNTAPTSSVFTIGNDNKINPSSNNMIAYCFAEKQSYSKFSSYVGNGNVSGTYVHLGFKPAFVMNKKTDGTMNWHIWDNKRNSYNIVDKLVYPNLSNAEDTLTSFDFVSNGFKIRDNRTFVNASGSPYIYMAFAENPFVTSTGVPATAR